MVKGLLTSVLLSGSLAFSALAAGPFPGQIKNLVTFGDSYTDVVSTRKVSRQRDDLLTSGNRMGTQTAG